MKDPFNPLRLNVGFMIKQPVGYSRDFLFNYDSIELHSDLILAHLNGNALLSRTPQGLLVQVHLSTTVECECVRCLVPFTQPISTNFTELYAFSERSVSESGLILPQDGHIDLTPLAREYLLLEIPINPICQKNCKGLCHTCGKNLNISQCDHDEIIIDPRFEKLRALLKE